MAQAEEHIRELLKSPVATRALAAQRLIESIDDDPEDPEAEMMRAAEVTRRAQADVAGTSKRIDAVLAFMLDFPEMGPLVEDVPPELGVHRQLVRRFGVELIYRISGDVVVVLALFHGKRRPGYWTDRLRSLR